MSVPEEPDLVRPIGPDDHVLGPVSAPVTLVEYGDYQCPYCGAAYEELQIVQRHLGPDLRFGFRHFPLVDIHPNALPAAVAAEAADRQGQFWAMHDTLFAHQDDLSPPSLLTYASALGLDMARFQRDTGDPAIIERIRTDITSGLASGVPGTPTYFVNGYRYEGPDDAASLLTILQSVARTQPGATVAIRGSAKGHRHKRSHPLPRVA